MPVAGYASTTCTHAQKVIGGYAPATVLDAVLADEQNMTSAMPQNAVSEMGKNGNLESIDDAPDFAAIPCIPASAQIPSMGPVVMP